MIANTIKKKKKGREKMYENVFHTTYLKGVIFSIIIFHLPIWLEYFLKNCFGQKYMF